MFASPKFFTHFPPSSYHTSCKYLAHHGPLNPTYPEYDKHTKLYPNILLSKLGPIQMKLLWIIGVGFEITDQVLNRFLEFVK
jgi:hypothetical protein